MEYEIDFLPVGDGERSGDAICLRYSGDSGNTWRVGIIDGGTTSSGEKLCEHIPRYYKTSNVDFVICTHPDQDHASGLSNVLDNLNVRMVMMHCPWDYVDWIFSRVSDGRVSKESLRNRLIEGHRYAYAVYEKALKKNIPIHHPFSDGIDHGIPCLQIVGPTSEYYLDQLVNFRSINAVTEDAKAQATLFDAVASAFKRAMNWVAESWDEEKLVDPEEDATSPENRSSVITYFNFGERQALFTGDAGVGSLDRAADRIEQIGLPLGELAFFHVPHHGSKRNLGPTVLNRLIGSPKPYDSESHFTSFISAAPDGAPKHPNRRVVNALTRRGAKVIGTLGRPIYHFTSGTSDRQGWSKVDPLPFYHQVEDDD